MELYHMIQARLQIFWHILRYGWLNRFLGKESFVSLTWLEKRADKRLLLPTASNIILQLQQEHILIILWPYKRKVINSFCRYMLILISLSFTSNYLFGVVSRCFMTICDFRLFFVVSWVINRIWVLIPVAGARKSGVLVQFSDLAFHMRTCGDLSDDELDGLVDFLHERVMRQERAELAQLALLGDRLGK